MQYYQQGDVLIKRVSQLPDGLELQEHKVLQHGETTGHMHQFAATDAVQVYHAPARTTEALESQWRTITENGNKFLVVDAPALLKHEEHAPILVDPGVYQIDIVREFCYDTYEMTRVVD